MAAFIILLLFCLVSVAGGYTLRRVDWQAIERDNERYTPPTDITSIMTVKSCAACGTKHKRRRRRTTKIENRVLNPRPLNPH